MAMGALAALVGDVLKYPGIDIHECLHRRTRNGRRERGGEFRLFCHGDVGSQYGEFLIFVMAWDFEPVGVEKKLERIFLLNAEFDGGSKAESVGGVGVKAIGDEVVVKVAAVLNLGVRITLQMELIDFEMEVHARVNPQCVWRKRNQILVGVERFFGDFKFHR